MHNWSSSNAYCYDTAVRNMSTNPFDVFELDETSPAETRWRIERLVVNLVRDGYIEFNVPDQTKKLSLDGALRAARRSRTLSKNSIHLVKALVILKVSHGLLLDGRTCTTREMYYRNKKMGNSEQWEEDRFLDDVHCERTLLLASYIVGSTRASLGFIPSSKGLVVGLSKDCSYATPLPHFRTASDLTPHFIQIKQHEQRPQFILVVEKHTVLHHLCQGRFFSRFPCIAVTGKGFPDLQTRIFIRACANYLGLRTVGLCDMNPHGLSILGCYAYGSMNMVGESFRYTMPDMVILGMTIEDGEHYRQLCTSNGVRPEFQEFQKRDDECIKGLESNATVLGNNALLNAINEFKIARLKLEIEAFESVVSNYLIDAWLPYKLGIVFGNGQFEQ